MSSRTYPYICCREEPTKFYVRLLRRGPNTFHAFCDLHLPKGGQRLVTGSNWQEVTKEDWLDKRVRNPLDTSSLFICVDGEGRDVNQNGDVFPGGSLDIGNMKHLCIGKPTP